MRIAEEHESIEAVFVEMDPVQDGFSGVLIELVAAGRATRSWRPLQALATDSYGSAAEAKRWRAPSSRPNCDPH